MREPPSLFQPAGGKPHQFRMNGKIPIGIGHMSMAQKGRQHGQPPFDVLVVPIPLNQRVDSESMSKIVNPRSLVVGGSAQSNLPRKIIESSVYGRDVQAAAMIIQEKAG
jgi:hypothetical protein